MRPDPSWEAVLDPGQATDFFAGAGDRPSFDPDATAWHLGNAWWCSEISRTVYRRDGRAAFFAQAGLAELQFFAEGGTQAALVRGTGHAVLVFRGTAELRDWLTNLRVAPVPWPHGGLVHEGFARALANVWHDVQSALDRLALPTFVTGHSLGGALATLAASQHEFAVAYTFGAPRVGDSAFWQTLRAPLHRVVNDRDIVPTLPPRRSGYTHGGVLRHLVADGGVADGTARRIPGDADFETVARSLVERKWFEPPAALADHAPVNYTAHLARSLA